MTNGKQYIFLDSLEGHNYNVSIAIESAIGNLQKGYHANHIYKIVNDDYVISVLKSAISDYWIDPSKQIDTSRIWVVRIEKLYNTEADMSIIISVNGEDDGMIECDSSTGENLLAAEISGEGFSLHIGTEDEEALRNRSMQENLFPRRLGDNISFGRSPSTMTECGIRTNVPELRAGETLQLHYICAIKEKAPHDDISTWLAVDQSSEWVHKLASSYFSEEVSY